MPLLSFASVPVVSAQQLDRPNIILMMADDLGWGDVGFTGNKVIKTPALDTLASEGVLLNHFYSAAPLSSPTRASVLTGRNPFRTGVFSANVGILRLEEVTLPELLHTLGYRTGHFGKWHLGTLTYREVDANRGRPDNRVLYNPPAQHGYDVAFVTESKVPTYDPMYKPVRNNGRFWDSLSATDSMVAYGTSYWDIDGDKIQEGLSGDDSRIILDRVLPFIEQSVKQEKPFFSVIWFHTPHLPCVAGAEYAALYPNASLEERNYYGCITAMDDQIGRLVRFLKEKGQYENTLILFCSDNGPEVNTPGTAGHLKGEKRSLHEGGIRVPAFMVWKNEVQAGQTLNVPCSTIDYYPTLAEVLKLDLSEQPAIDGESVWPFITGRSLTRKKALVFCSDHQGAVVSGDYKLYYSAGKYALYNIAQDPGESQDLSADYPEKLKELKLCLLQELEAYKASFEGKDYGTESYDKMKQAWWDVMSGDE